MNALKVSNLKILFMEMSQLSPLRFHIANKSSDARKRKEVIKREYITGQFLLAYSFFSLILSFNTSIVDVYGNATSFLSLTCKLLHVLINKGIVSYILMTARLLHETYITTSRMSSLLMNAIVHKKGEKR